jgi:hypothetical protein
MRRPALRVVRSSLLGYFAVYPRATIHILRYISLRYDYDSSLHTFLTTMHPRITTSLPLISSTQNIETSKRIDVPRSLHKTKRRSFSVHMIPTSPYLSITFISSDGILPKSTDATSWWSLANLARDNLYIPSSLHMIDDIPIRIWPHIFPLILTGLLYVHGVTIFYDMIGM